MAPFLRYVWSGNPNLLGVPGSKLSSHDRLTLDHERGRYRHLRFPLAYPFPPPMILARDLGEGVPFGGQKRYQMGRLKDLRDGWLLVLAFQLRRQWRLP